MGNRKNFKTSFKNQNIKQKDTPSNWRMKSKKNRIDFEKLGTNSMCLRCGNNYYLSKHCRLNPNNVNCKSCKLTGHVKKYVSKHYSMLRDHTVSKYKLTISKHVKMLQ